MVKTVLHRSKVDSTNSEKSPGPSTDEEPKDYEHGHVLRGTQQCAAHETQQGAIHDPSLSTPPFHDPVGNQDPKECSCLGNLASTDPKNGILRSYLEDTRSCSDQLTGIGCKARFIDKTHILEKRRLGECRSDYARRISKGQLAR